MECVLYENTKKFIGNNARRIYDENKEICNCTTTEEINIWSILKKN